MNELKNLGFTNVETKPVSQSNSFLTKRQNIIQKISIDGTSNFHSNTYFDRNAKIIIIYYDENYNENEQK